MNNITIAADVIVRSVMRLATFAAVLYLLIFQGLGVPELVAVGGMLSSLAASLVPSGGQGN